MEMIETLVIVVHVLVSLGLVALVLLQQGKGAEAGASFGGGASQTVFGSQGSGSFLTKMTSVFAFIFFITSFSLAVFAKQKADIGPEQGIPMIPEEIVSEGVALESSEGVPSAEEVLGLETSSEKQKALELE